MGRLGGGLFFFNGDFLIFIFIGLGLGLGCLCFFLKFFPSFLKAEGQAHGEPECKEDEGQDELDSADDINNFFLIAVEEGKV